LDLQKYLRLHAATDDFATTVSKARHFMDASELARTAKKPAIRATSTSVNYQAIVDGVMEALELHNQGRMTEVNAAQVTNPGSRNKKPAPCQGSPVPSDTSAGSRASSTGRTVRFQDQGSQSSQSSNQAYGSSSRTRWSGNQSPQGNSTSPRPWMDRRQQGQETPRSQPPSSGSGWTSRQGGPRFPPPQSESQWTSGQSGPRFFPRPRVIQATGDRDGVRRQETVMVSHRSSSRTRRDSADGAEAQLISSLMVLLICRHLDAVIAMFAATHVATRISTRKLLCRPRRRQSLGAMYVASLDAIRPGIASMIDHPHPMHQVRKSLDLLRGL